MTAVDKKSRVPEEEKVVCSSRGGERDPESLRRRKGSEAPKEEKGANIFFLHCFSLVNITVYLARGHVSPSQNLLTNLVILRQIFWEVWSDLFIVSSNLINLKCMLREWVW